MTDNKLAQKTRCSKSRKINVIKPSKYEASAAIKTNKKYWKSIFNKMDPLTGSTAEIESKKLAEILPHDLYEKVCGVLNIPDSYPQDEDEVKKSTDRAPRRMLKEPLVNFRKTLIIDREMDSDTDVEISPRNDSEGELNIYQEFLQRPEREQISWPSRYLQPELEEHKDLVRRADHLTDRIANEFCDYMKQLGGDQQSQLFTPKAIKDLFQVEFDTHVANSLKVIPKELPTVTDRIAEMSGNPKNSREAYLQRQVDKDIKAENRADNVLAFGRSLPLEDQWRAPHNDTMELWRSAKHVPKDLVTLKTVWEGITNLRSVKEYCRWMIGHPEYRRAPYLRSLGMFDSAVLDARLTMESRYGFKPMDHTEPSDIPTTVIPSNIDQIRNRLSQLSDTI